MGRSAFSKPRKPSISSLACTGKAREASIQQDAQSMAALNVYPYSWVSNRFIYTASMPATRPGLFDGSLPSRP
jgi:hypothetical protein